MSLEHRSHRFYVVYRPDGRYGRRVRIPVPLTCQDEPAARKWHDDFIREWHEAKGQPKEPHALTGLSIEKLWLEYMKWSELHHAATTHRDVLNVGKYVKKYLGQYDAEGIGPHHVQIYQRLRTAEAGRPINRTVNKELNYLGGMVRWAGKQGHITARRFSIDKLPCARPIPNILTVDEVVRIIDAAEPFYQAFFLCLYSLGLRLTEAKSLKWGENINFESMTVKVKQKGGTFKILPLGGRLKAALETITPRNDGEHVFVISKWTKRPIYDARKAIGRACEKAKIARHVNPHLFRHSIASHLMSENTNVSIIQRFLGHSLLTTTQWYSHVSTDNLKGAGRLIEGLLKTK